MNKLWAVEKNYLLDYQERIINASSEEIKAAESMFSGQELPDILFIEGDTAIIKIKGVLSKTGPSWLDRYYGYDGTGYDDIIESINEINNHPEVKTVILQMNTPGGGINGVDEVYIGIKNLSKQKTVIAENHGLIASAGYWIASAASKIVAIGPAVETGSIGVIITAIDDTEFLKEMGLKRIKIVSSNAPKKDPNIAKKAGQNILQDRVDALERIFIKRIADGRKLTEAHVREKFGRGSVLIADDPDESKDDALNVKMIDSVVNRIGKSLPSKESDDDDEEPEDEKKHMPMNGLAAIHEPKTDIKTEYETYIAGFAGTNTQKSPELHIKTPAVAGENPVKAGDNIQEDTKMTLNEIMSSDPAVKAEVEGLKAESKNAGVIEGRAEIQTRIDAAVNYIGNENYPKIDALAIKVLKGESKPSALEGAVTAYDMLKEQQNSETAKGEGEKIPETPAEPGAEMADDVMQAVAESKKMIGRA